MSKTKKSKPAPPPAASLVMESIKAGAKLTDAAEMLANRRAKRRVELQEAKMRLAKSGKRGASMEKVERIDAWLNKPAKRTPKA